MIGLGYVGLPLAVEFANVGFSVTGIDVLASKIAELNVGRSYIQDVPTEIVSKHVESGHLRGTADFSVIAELDTVNIAVPTPLRKTKDPDMSFVVAAAEQVASYLHPGIDDLSGNHRRDIAAHARAERPQGRRGLLPLFFA